MDFLRNESEIPIPRIRLMVKKSVWDEYLLTEIDGIKYIQGKDTITKEKVLLLDFYADWCGPCKMMAPIVEALSEELSDVKVCHINIDENIDIAQKYRVMSIPTFIAFKGGEESGRQIGAIPKTALVDLVK